MLGLVFALLFLWTVAGIAATLAFACWWLDWPSVARRALWVAMFAAGLSVVLWGVLQFGAANIATGF